MKLDSVYMLVFVMLLYNRFIYVTCHLCSTNKNKQYLGGLCCFHDAPAGKRLFAGKLKPHERV